MGVGVGGNVGIGAVIGVGVVVEACLPTVRRYASTDSTTLIMITRTRTVFTGFFSAAHNLRRVLTVRITSTHYKDFCLLLITKWPREFFCYSVVRSYSNRIFTNVQEFFFSHWCLYIGAFPCTVQGRRKNATNRFGNTWSTRPRRGDWVRVSARFTPTLISSVVLLS